MSRPRLTSVKAGEPAPEQPELVAFLEAMLFEARAGKLTDLVAVGMLEGEPCRHECHDFDLFAVAGVYQWGARAALDEIDEDDEDPE